MTPINIVSILVAFFAGLGIGYWISLTYIKETVSVFTDTTKYAVEMMSAYVKLIEEKNKQLEEKYKENSTQ